MPEGSSPFFISTSISILSICSLAYFAGKFSEKLATIERKVETHVEISTVDKDVLAVKESLAKDIKHLSHQMEEVKREVENVRNDFSRAISQKQFENTH